MNWIVGVDGCPRGWIAIGRREGCLKSSVVTRFEAVLREFEQPDVVAVDIPIGLTDRDARQCDLVARRQLGPRASSVFPAPIRPCLAAVTYEDAARISRECQNKGISKQSFAIFKKIREVDEFLRSDARLPEVVLEVHPEICFQAWNGGRPMQNPKKDAEGAAERRKLVDGYFGGSAFADVRALYARKDVADDDILDAFAALWTAERVSRGESRTLPTNPARDSAGLPMQMVY